MAVRHYLCGKRVFKNRKGANRRCEELNESTEKNWRVYRCVKCGLYHLTTKSAGQIKRNLKKAYRKNIQTLKQCLKRK